MLPAWKLALLDDALPKYTAAIQACKNSDDTTEAIATTKDFLKLVSDIVIQNVLALKPVDSLPPTASHGVVEYSEVSNEPEEVPKVSIEPGHEAKQVVEEIEEVLQKEKLFNM